MNDKNNSFDKGPKETIKYKKISGLANAPAEYISPSGYKLGNWQYSQNALYNQGKLSEKKIEKLEAIGFIWRKGRTPEDSFKLGYKKTLEYMKVNGDPNAKSDYVTSDGYRLGSWQGYIRSRYKEGKLSFERIKLLEDIGFKWKKYKSIIEKNE